MLPVHTILHATDFSERSESALAMAGSLAKEYGAKVIILHVAEPSNVYLGPGMIGPVPGPSVDELKQRLEEYGLDNTRFKSERLLVEGHPPKEILRIAAENQVDLIVMGTHGRSGVSRLLLGSVAEEVMRHAECPVMTLKRPFAEEGTG